METKTLKKTDQEKKDALIKALCQTIDKHTTKPEEVIRLVGAFNDFNEFMHDLADWNKSWVHIVDEILNTVKEKKDSNLSLHCSIIGNTFLEGIITGKEYVASSEIMRDICNEIDINFDEIMHS